MSSHPTRTPTAGAPWGPSTQDTPSIPRPLNPLRIYNPWIRPQWQPSRTHRSTLAPVYEHGWPPAPRAATPTSGDSAASSDSATLVDAPRGRTPSPPLPPPCSTARVRPAHPPPRFTPALPSSHPRAPAPAPAPAPELTMHPIPDQHLVPQRLRLSGLEHDAHDIPEALAVARVPFELRARLLGVRGVPMRLLLNPLDAVQSLRDPHAHVLRGLPTMGVVRIHLSIMWPAYPDFPYECTIRVADGGNMEGLTRAMLAWRIGVAFYGFVQAAALNPPSIDPWAARFRFGEGALVFGNLWLVALWQVSTDTFEAEVRFTRAVM